jgi:hypothetical protein
MQFYVSGKMLWIKFRNTRGWFFESELSVEWKFWFNYRGRSFIRRYSFQNLTVGFIEIIRESLSTKSNNYRKLSILVWGKFRNKFRWGRK